MPVGRIPDLYRLATLKNVTPNSQGFVGVGFNCADGTAVYLCLPASDLAVLHQLTGPESQLAGLQSRGSSGMPSVDVSSTPRVD